MRSCLTAARSRVCPQLHKCGDGVVDLAAFEDCDDMNLDNTDDVRAMHCAIHAVRE